jgi:hypothetical protein
MVQGFQAMTCISHEKMEKKLVNWHWAGMLGIWDQ